MSGLRDRIRRLERRKVAADNRPATADQLRAEAAGTPVRPVVAQAAALLREIGRRCDPWLD